MIEILELKREPLEPGEKRRLVLDGDAPFQVSTSCFVDEPKPAGFRPCAQCETTSVKAKQESIIEAGFNFWTGKTGSIAISIGDAVGESLEIELRVLSDTDRASRLSIAQA